MIKPAVPSNEDEDDDDVVRLVNKLMSTARDKETACRSIRIEASLPKNSQAKRCTVQEQTIKTWPVHVRHMQPRSHRACARDGFVGLTQVDWSWIPDGLRHLVQRNLAIQLCEWSKICVKITSSRVKLDGGGRAEGRWRNYPKLDNLK